MQSSINCHNKIISCSKCDIIYGDLWRWFIAKNFKLKSINFLSVCFNPNLIAINNVWNCENENEDTKETLNGIQVEKSQHAKSLPEYSRSSNEPWDSVVVRGFIRRFNIRTRFIFANWRQFCILKWRIREIIIIQSDWRYRSCCYRMTIQTKKQCALNSMKVYCFWPAINLCELFFFVCIVMW